MADVRLINVNKKFGSVTANENVNLHIRDGEFFVLLGPSGCGKTTTLRIVAGLETPDTGEIYIGDRLVNDLPPGKRNIAMVFQNYALYPHMTVFDNIAFPLKVAKLHKTEIASRVKWALDLLRIEELENRKPRQLSGGQQQRVAVGRAVVRQPDVFLLDEPLSNLDALLRIRMRSELKRLFRDIKATAIYVTHDQVEAMTMAKRIAVMRFGKIEQLATPHEIYHRPRTRFIASFIGSPPMNFLDGTLTERNGKSYIDLEPFSIEILPKVAKLIKEKATSSKVIFGIRPEDIIIQKKRTPEYVESCPCEVYVAEPLGSELLVNLTIGENIVKVKTAPSLDVNIGEKVWTRFRKDKIHIFDSKTEELIF
jgi:multiple sugar transport system ATP-binding protein